MKEGNWPSVWAEVAALTRRAASGFHENGGSAQNMGFTVGLWLAGSALVRQLRVALPAPCGRRPRAGRACPVSPHGLDESTGQPSPNWPVCSFQLTGMHVSSQPLIGPARPAALLLTHTRRLPPAAQPGRGAGCGAGVGWDSSSAFVFRFGQKEREESLMCLQSMHQSFSWGQ